jgi:hypothetical protein
MFDGVMIEELQKDLLDALKDFSVLYDKYKNKRDKTAVERKIFMIAFHAYEKRLSSPERFMPSSIMAICQYEGYAKKLKKWKLLESYGGRSIEAKEINPEEEEDLNFIISAVKNFRDKWKIPAFKIIQPALCLEELDETANYVEKNLLKSKIGLSSKLDFKLKEVNHGR